MNKEDTIFLHPPGEHISDFIRSSKTFYEIDLLHFIERNYKNQNEIIDVGANIGNHSYFFAKYLNSSKVHAFEPMDVNLKLLYKNLDPVSYKTIIYPFALSNIEEEIPVYNTELESNFGAFSLCKSKDNLEIHTKIKTYKLDTFKLKNISMIKIDVENHENQVLEGAKETIMNNKPIIFIENLYHHHHYPELIKDEDTHKKILQGYNYQKKYSNIGNTMMDLWIPSD
jgi:FkbM family methyltransferase